MTHVPRLPVVLFWIVGYSCVLAFPAWADQLRDSATGYATPSLSLALQVHSHWDGNVASNSVGVDRAEVELRHSPYKKVGYALSLGWPSALEPGETLAAPLIFPQSYPGEGISINQRSAREQLHLLDAYANYTPYEWFSVRAGQLTVPFGLEADSNWQSSPDSHRSPVTQRIHPGRSPGIQISGSAGPLQYAARAFGSETITNHTPYGMRLQISPVSKLSIGGSHWRSWNPRSEDSWPHFAGDLYRWGSDIVFRQGAFTVQGEYGRRDYRSARYVADSRTLYHIEEDLHLDEAFYVLIRARASSRCVFTTRYTSLLPPDFRSPDDSRTQSSRKELPSSVQSLDLSVSIEELIPHMQLIIDWAHILFDRDFRQPLGFYYMATLRYRFHTAPHGATPL